MSNSLQEDQALVEQWQGGDDAGFEEIMRRYKRPVLSFVYRLLGDATDAEDVAQEVFVKAYQRIDTFRPEARFSTWLFALARHAAIDRLRWRRRHPVERLDSLPDPSGGAEVTAEIHAREVEAQIAAAVGALPEEQRTAVVLSEYEDLSHAEIAEIMRCSEKSVESRLYRARLDLREKLKHLL